MSDERGEVQVDPPCPLQVLVDVEVGVEGLALVALSASQNGDAHSRSSDTVLRDALEFRPEQCFLSSFPHSGFL